MREGDHRGSEGQPPVRTLLELEADLSGDGLEVDLSQSGPTAFLGIVYRFGGAPPAIR